MLKVIRDSLGKAREGTRNVTEQLHAENSIDLAYIPSMGIADLASTADTVRGLTTEGDVAQRPNLVSDTPGRTVQRPITRAFDPITDI